MKRSFHKYLRATGNITFVAFAAPFALRRPSRGAWHAYLACHALHAANLAAAARAWRRRGGPPAFGKTSRYGGALGYATVAALTLTSYVPAGEPPARVRRVHVTGEYFLFGLYAFTIAHGYLEKGRDARVYGPLAALWLVAALRQPVESVVRNFRRGVR